MNQIQKVSLSFIFCLCTLLGLALWAPQAAEAIGISPPLTHIDSVLRGSSQSKSIDVSKDFSQMDEEVQYVVSIRTPYDGAIDAPTAFTIPAGELHYTYSFQVNSAHASNGDYEAIFVFTETPVVEDTADTGGLSAISHVVEGAAAVVQYTISGSETISYTVTDLSAASIETDDVLLMKYDVTNDGNVSWRPDKISLVFTDRQDSAKTYTAEVAGDTLSYSEPGTNDSFAIEVPVEFVVGSYIATGIFYDDDTAVATLISQPFDVFPPNTLAQVGSITSAKTNKTSYEPNENIKVDVAFENTGDTRVTGTLLADVYVDESLKDYISGEELVVDAGETSTFSHIFKFSDPGDYRLELSVEYANKKTAVESVTFTVLSPHSILSPIVISTIAILVVCVVSVVIVVKRRKKRKNQRSIRN